MSDHYQFRHSIYEYIIQIYSISKLKHAHNALEILNQILNELKKYVSGQLVFCKKPDSVAAELVEVSM